MNQAVGQSGREKAPGNPAYPTLLVFNSNVLPVQNLI